MWPHFLQRHDQTYVKDIPSVRIDFSREGIHFIRPKSIEYPTLWNYYIIMELKQLPLILCWAYTVLEMQGCTVYPCCVVYLGNAYCSKKGIGLCGNKVVSDLRSLKGFIIEEIDCFRLTGQTTCNDSLVSEALEEMKWLLRLPPPKQIFIFYILYILSIKIKEFNLIVMSNLLVFLPCWVMDSHT